MHSMLYNTLTRLIISLLIISMLFGCAITNHGYGVVIAGAVSGAILLGSFASWYGFMEVGLGSALAGAASGYIIEKSKGRSTLYQFTVKSLNDATKIYTVRQYSTLIPLNTKVKVLERNGTIFIRKN